MPYFYCSTRCITFRCHVSIVTRTLAVAEKEPIALIYLVSNRSLLLMPASFDAVKED